MRGPQTRDELRHYLEADRLALGFRVTARNLLFEDAWAYQRALRRYEYATNTNARIRRAFYWLRLRRLSRRTGLNIGPNVFGPGLNVAHAGPVVVNMHAEVGKNCRVQWGVGIGTQAGTSDECPTIGDNCYIGPGAKLFGNIVIGDNVAIAANAVVNKSFPEGNCTLGGIPARVISDKTSQEYTRDGDALALR